jgi:hypothetical protein
MKTIIEMTRELGGFAPTPEFLAAFAELVRADEREACAVLFEEMTKGRHLYMIRLTNAVAAAIRARGNT